jgi:hypothetical protein
LQRMQREAWLLGRRDGAASIADIALQLARPRMALRQP